MSVINNGHTSKWILSIDVPSNWRGICDKYVKLKHRFLCVMWISYLDRDIQVQCLIDIHLQTVIYADMVSAERLLAC